MTRPISRFAMAALCAWLFAAATESARAAACAFAEQGEGRVDSIIDGRSFRLSDGREIRLAGIEPATTGPKESRAAALSAMVAGQAVTLRGADDAPDRYGRQSAFVFLSDTLV